MNTGSRLKNKRNMAQIINKVTDILKKEKRVSIAKLTFLLGYTSYEYFNRSVVPIIVELTTCIEKDGNYLVWICDEKDDEVRKILDAKPLAEDNQSEVSWGKSKGDC